MDGPNNHTWNASFELYVKAQRRYSHLTIVAPMIPTTTMDNKTLEEYNKYVKIDYVVMTLLVNSIDTKISTYASLENCQGYVGLAISDLFSSPKFKGNV